MCPAELAEETVSGLIPLINERNPPHRRRVLGPRTDAVDRGPSEPVPAPTWIDREISNAMLVSVRVPSAADERNRIDTV